MEGAGRSLDEELAAAMRERGLGTPATRAGMIEELVAKGYLVREAKALRPTPLGIGLIRTVHPHVASPAMTGEWEAGLRKVERGELEAAELLTNVESFVCGAVRTALANGVASRPIRPNATAPVATHTRANKANQREKDRVRKRSAARRDRRGM